MTNNNEIIKNLEKLPDDYQTCFDLWLQKNNHERQLDASRRNLKEAEKKLIKQIGEVYNENKIVPGELDTYIINNKAVISLEWGEDDYHITYEPVVSSQDRLNDIITMLRPEAKLIEQPKKERKFYDILESIAVFNPLNLMGMNQESANSLALLEKELFIKAQSMPLFGDHVILKPEGLAFNKVVIFFDRPRIEYFYITGDMASRGIIL